MMGSIRFNFLFVVNRDPFIFTVENCVWGVFYCFYDKYSICNQFCTNDKNELGKFPPYRYNFLLDFEVVKEKRI